MLSWHPSDVKAVFVHDKPFFDDSGLIKVTDGNHMFKALQNVWSHLNDASETERATMRAAIGPLAMQRFGSQHFHVLLFEKRVMAT